MKKQEMFIVTEVSRLDEPYMTITCEEDNLIRMRADLLIPVQSIKGHIGNTQYYGQLCYVLVKEKESGNYDVFQGKMV